MLATLTALAVITLFDPPDGKEPPTKEELAAITERGRDLAGYDAAAWHASDAVQAKQPKEGSFVRYIARKVDKRWVVAFGRLDEKAEKFLIAYEATQGDKPDVFDVKEMIPLKEDTGFFLSAAEQSTRRSRTSWNISRASSVPTTSLFSPRRRGKSGFILSRLRPNRTCGRWEAMSAIWSQPMPKIVSKRQLHKSVIEVEPPKDNDNQQVAGIHTHVLDDTPEDTDVFHVLTRKPAVPEMVMTKQFVFQVDPDGSVKYVGKSEDVLNKK